ncbi:MAG: alanine--tRNA ligase-related protein, partial [Bacteroidota bacterium]|nr:alanine--tRNA ligase-related protein [Bacteroidota bacterium]
AKTMGNAFPELNTQKTLIEKVIYEEEQSFLKTLDIGIKRFDQIITKVKADGYNFVKGSEAFELYDTFGFPFDLTELILKENNMRVSKREFDEEMAAQKNRSRNAATLETGDWQIILHDDKEEFIGYDNTRSEIKITRYRKVKQKNKELFQLVFNYTPFYAESGGQVGDKGYIRNEDEKIEIINTVKENNLSVHIAKKLPANINADFEAVINEDKRNLSANNHTATHLLHFALRKVLGNHVEQKGSLVEPARLRFDYSHFQKLSSEDILKVEKMVNQMIRDNISLDEKREIPLKDAQEMGAMSLFGEKYGDIVRVIRFGDSVELCGGTHVKATGNIGMIKITGESAIAAGIRRIEAVTGNKVEDLLNENINSLQKLTSLFKNQSDLIKNVENLIFENTKLTKSLEVFSKEKLKNLKATLKDSKETINGINLIRAKLDISSAGEVKDIAFQLKDEVDNLIFVGGAEIDGKANLSVMISHNLVEEKGLNAGQIIRELAKEIQGGGGGQAFFATAGGKNPAGIEKALDKAREIVMGIG